MRPHWIKDPDFSLGPFEHAEVWLSLVASRLGRTYVEIYVGTVAGLPLGRGFRTYTLGPFTVDAGEADRLGRAHDAAIGTSIRFPPSEPPREPSWAAPAT